MACEELKREANQSTIEEKAKMIYEDYISILSPKEVCVCKCLLRAIAKLAASVFGHVLLEQVAIFQKHSHGLLPIMSFRFRGPWKKHP